MYLHHFGLREKPFALAHNPSYYYPAAHQEATNDLCYSIEERQGLAMLVGEPGTGKTTLLGNLMRSLGADMLGILVSDVSLLGGSLLKQLAHRLQLPAADAQALLTMLQIRLQNNLSTGHTVVVLIDEAQSLTDGQLQEVRYLTNLEFQNQKLVQLVLAGQPSLESKLEAPQFEALRQRVAVRTSIEPLSLEHTRGYIQWQLQVAGARGTHPFTPSALVRIHELSRGIPRLINLICDRALLMGYAEDTHVLDEAVVDETSSELRIPWPVPEEGLFVPPVYELPGTLLTSPPSMSLPPPGSQPLEQRLTGIERKLDMLAEAMRKAGFLEATRVEAPQGESGEEHPQVNPKAEAERLKNTEPKREHGSGRLADFPPRRPSRRG